MTWLTPLFSRKQTPPKRWAAGFFACLSVLCAVASLAALAIRTPAPQPVDPATAMLARQRDEAALHLLVLQESEGGPEFVGIATEKGVIDPDQATMRILKTKAPCVRPASQLVEPGSKKDKSSFTLAVSDVREWKGKNEARVRAGYYFSSGGYSAQHYMATRDWFDWSRWNLASDARGCGAWQKVPIVTPQGAVRILVHERGHP